MTFICNCKCSIRKAEALWVIQNKGFILWLRLYTVVGAGEDACWHCIWNGSEVSLYHQLGIKYNMKSGRRKTNRTPHGSVTTTITDYEHDPQKKLCPRAAPVSGIWPWSQRSWSRQCSGSSSEPCCSTTPTRGGPWINNSVCKLQWHLIPYTNLQILSRPTLSQLCTWKGVLGNVVHLTTLLTHNTSTVIKLKLDPPRDGLPPLKAVKSKCQYMSSPKC